MMTNNEVKGYGVAGSRHAGASQDAFWSSKGVPSEVRQQLGELYLFSDGVTHCADGLLASQLAVQTVRKYYYGQRPTHDLTPTDRLTRLQKAVWQAHRQLASWDETFYCWQKEAHPDGKTVAFSRQVLEHYGKFQNGIAHCPLCNKRMDGLLATLLAVVIHEQHLFLVGIGDSFALHIPADPQQPIKWLYNQKKGEFLGSSTLSYDQLVSLHHKDPKLKTNDLIVLCSDGVIATLEELSGTEKYDLYLRQKLQEQSLSRSVPKLIHNLDDYRKIRPNLNDDLTLQAFKVAAPQPVTSEDTTDEITEPTPTEDTTKKLAKSMEGPDTTSTPTEGTEEENSNKNGDMQKAARLAFQEHKLAEAAQILEKVECSEDKYLLRKDWQKLWHDPDHDFELHVDPSFMTSLRGNFYSLTHLPRKFYSLTQLATLLKAAAEVNQLLTQALRFHASDNQGKCAETCWKKLMSLSNKNDFKNSLPASMGTIRLALAKKLAKARFLVFQNKWPKALNALQDEQSLPSSDKLRSAREAYAAVVLRSFLGLESNVLEKKMASDLFERIKWLREYYPSASVLVKAETLKEQGNIIEAVGVALQMPSPKKLARRERNALEARRQAFVDEAWEFTLKLASGQESINGLEPAIQTLQQAKLDQIPAVDAARVRALGELLPVVQQANNPISAALAAQRIRIHPKLTRQDKQKLLMLRSKRINQAWQWAFNKAKAAKSIKDEQKSEIKAEANKLSTTKEQNLRAAGLLLEASLAFQADKFHQAIKPLLEAWLMVEDQKKNQMYQLAHDVYFNVNFWQIELNIQLRCLYYFLDLGTIKNVKLLADLPSWVIDGLDKLFFEEFLDLDLKPIKAELIEILDQKI